MKVQHWPDGIMRMNAKVADKAEGSRQAKCFLAHAGSLREWFSLDSQPVPEVHCEQYQPTRDRRIESLLT